MTEIRPLTAEEYRSILTEHEVSLRVSDGTPEETWRFWVQDGDLMYRRLTGTMDGPADELLLESVLEGDGTTQLVVVDEGVETEPPEDWPESFWIVGEDPTCPHHMVWNGDGYRCIYECGRVEEEPPKRSIEAERKRREATSR